MLQTWKNIVLNWTNCYFTESLEKEQSLTVESLQSIISHLRENINLDESKSSTLEAFSIEEFLSEKYPEFKFENGTVEPNNEDEYYLVASLLLFFVCTNSKDLDIKNAMCSKLSTHDQEVILKYSKTLMEVPQVKYKDVHAAILEACQEIVAAPPRSIISETPPSLRSLHSEVRRLQAALDAERFDRNFLQEELSRNNSRLEKLSKEKEQFKLEILNLKAKISLCCGQEKSTPSQSGDINSTIYAKQVQDLEDRLVHTQEQLEDAEYERESYRTKINELKQEREKWHLLNQELATQVDQLQEELDTEKRLSQSYRELVYELRIHNQRNCLDNSQLEWDDLEASFHIIPPHNTSNTSEDGVKPNLSHEIVTLKDELHSKLLIEIEQMKTQNSNINSLLKKEIERNEQSYKEHLLENQQMLRKYEELTALKDATVLELQNKNVMIENLQKSITEKSKLVEDLQCDLASLNNTVKEQNINISSMQEVIDELRTEIKRLLENESYLQDCNKNNIADIEGLTEQMTLNANAKAKLEKEVQCLNHELINLRQEQSHADFQLQSLKEEHNKLELRYNKQIEKSNQELVDLESRLQEETSKCSILQEQQNIFKKELDFNKLKVSDLLKEIKLKENEILSFKNEIEHLLNDLEKCKNLLHVKVETIDKLEFEVRELKEGFENKNKKIDSLEKINGKLEHENKIIKDLFETEKNMSYRIIEEKQKQIDNLMVEISQTNSLVENIKRKLQEETSKCSILQEQQNNVEKELEDKRSRNLDLLQEIKVKTTEYVSLENELQKRNNEIYDKDEIINKLSIEVRESKDSIENKIEEFNSLRQINVTLENEIKTIKDLLQTEKITSNKVIEEKQKCIEDLMVKLSQTNSAVENIKSKLHEEYNKFSILQEQQNNVEKELEDKRSMNLDLLKEVKVKETDILSLENELQKCRKEIHNKQQTINKLLLEVRESKDCFENKIKEFDTIRQLNVKLENENKIIKDLLQTEKITSEEKQKNTEDLMEELNQTNSLVENVKSRLEDETSKCSTLQEQLNNVGKELDDMKSKILDLLQDIKDKETEIMSLKNEKDNLSEHLQMYKTEIHDKDGTINKLLLEVGELKENIEIKNKEFESVNIKLENENKIINDLLETEKHTSYKIIEEKQKHIENIKAELSQTNDIIQRVKEENSELSQALNDERIEKTKISKDKEELGHENKILIDLLETVKQTARSTINEKQSQIEKLLQEVDDKYKSIQILDTEKCNLQSVIDQNREENKALKDVLEKEKNNSSSTINEKQSQIDKLLNEMHSKDKSIQILNEDKRNLQSCIVQKEEEITAHEKHIFELNHQNKILNDVATAEKISVQNVLREKESKIAELMEKLDLVSREKQELIANIAILKQQINAKEETINELSETEKRLQKLLLQNAQDKITINDLSQQIEACNSQLVDTNEEVKRLTDLSNTQKQQIEDKERIILELITEKDDAILALNKNILEEKESKDNLVNELESKNVMIQNLQESIEEKIKLVEETQHHLESLNITIKEQNDKITSSKEAIDELESEKNRLLQNESHLQEINQNYSADVESNLFHIKGLTEQITLNANAKANLEKEVQYLNHELISLRKELSAKDFKLKSLKDEYNKLELKYNEQIEKNNLLFIESENKLKQESNKCFTLQEQQNNFKTEFDAKTSKISELLEEVETKKTEILTLKNERDLLANNLRKRENELLDKDETIKKLLFEVREINEGIQSKIKEFDSLGQLNVKLEQENKINKDLLQTEKTTSHRIIEEKQKQIEDLTVELSQTNSVVENVKSKLEEETSKFSILQEQQNNVEKELEDKRSNILDLLQEIKVKETEVLTLKNEKNNIWDTLQKCKNEIHDKAETITKLSLEVRELKENIEIKNKEFESLEKLNVKLESDYKIIKDSLETEKHMSHTIIEEKQLKIDNIMAELSETKSLIEGVKKENYVSSEALNNERKEKTSISKDKEELIQENKTLKDLLEAEKTHASSSINEKQAQIDKLLYEIHSKDKAIQILEEEKQNLQSVIVQYQEENGAIEKRIFELDNQNKILNDGAKVEKDSLQNVLQDKENKIAQLMDNLESVSRERLELIENIAMFKQQISVYEAKINDLTEMENRLQKLLLENSQYKDTINDLKEQIIVCNAQINNNKSNEEVKRLTDMLNTQKEQLTDRDSIILKLITEKDAVIGAMSKELLEEKDMKDKLLRELDSKNVIVSELKLQISELKKEEMMNCLRRENDELIKAVGQRETLLMASQEKSGSKSNNSEKQHRMYIQVDNSAPLDNTQSSLDSYKTISDLEKIIHDKNRTITTLQSDLTYIKSLMAESENKLLDVSKELEIQKEISDQLSSQLKKIVNQKNDEIADLKKQLNKMSVTENRASEIIKLSAKYQAIILKRIAEIKTNTVLKELQNFGNSATSEHELRRLHAGSVTMDDLENFLETTERHLKRFSEKQIALQKERDRLHEVTRINESEIIGLKKFLTELSLSFKTFSSVKEVYTQKLSKVVAIQRTVRREILNSEGHITDAAMCKLERGYAAVMQDLVETVLNIERWVERCLGRTISPEKIKQAFTSDLDRYSLSSSSYQNTGLEVQLEELEKSFQKLLEEVSQSRRGEGSKDAQSVTVMEVRAEYEDKLNRMKAKMKQLFEEQIAKFKEKQKKEISDLNMELDKAKENLAESSKAYEEHIRALTTELWSVGEKFLIQKDEAEWLRKKQRSGSLMSLQHYHSAGLGVAVEEPVGRPSDTASLRSLPVIPRNSDVKTNKKREGRGLHMSDEEGEVFDNRCLKELTSTPRAPSNSGKRLSELQWRNSLCPPHLKSSYPAETQFAQSVHEEDIKHSLGAGSTLPGRNQRKEVGITAYKKPGPPTPSKQAGRLSATDSELRESLRVEMNPHASRKTGTPSRLRALFRSTRNDTSDNTPRRRLSNIFRKK